MNESEQKKKSKREKDALWWQGFLTYMGFALALLAGRYGWFDWLFKSH